MNKYIRFFILLVCLAVIPFSVKAASFIQLNYATPQTPTQEVTVTLPNYQTAGNLNVVVVGWNDSVANVQSVTDSRGNTYSLAIGPTKGNNLRQSVYYAPNVFGGSNTIRVVFDRPAQYPDVRVLEYSGINSVDAVSGSSGTSNVSKSGYLRTKNANDLIVAANTVQKASVRAGTGYTLRVITKPDADIVQDRSTAYTGSYQAKTPLDSSSGSWVMQAVAFKQSSTVVPVATYSLSKTAVNGTITANPNQTTYTSGTSVTLTATPNSGYTFSSWSGDCSGSASTCTLSMTANKSVTANFTLIPVISTYTISKNAVNGSISANPNQSVYNSGTYVTLTATPNSGYSLSNWSGDCTGASATCGLSMTSDKTVGANFVVIPVYYTISKTASNGTISLNPNQTSYLSGTTVTLTATPNSGYTFSGWSGSCTGTSATCTLNMNSDKTVTANFTAIPVYYTISKTVSNGTISANPNQTSYLSGTTVTLTATPNSGYQFAGWSGACTGTATTCIVSMTSNKSVIANFTLIPVVSTYTLYKSSTNGTITANPNQTTYTSGTSVTLTATPNSGYTFSSWSGDCSGTASTCTLSLTANKSVTANFTQVVVTPPVTGNFRYVRQGATGNGSGTDWTNAYPTLPATLMRGYTYYIADVVNSTSYYPEYIFNDPVSGSQYITIKKATISEHGTNDGWQNSYGDGQAVFAGGISFATGYWVFDGATGGGPGSWTTGFGFKVGGNGEVVDTDAGVSNITIKHVEVQGRGDDGDGSFPNNDLFHLAGNNILVSHVYLHDAGRTLFMGASSNTTIEYTYGGRHESTPGQHSEVASIWNWEGTRPQNWIIRNSIWSHIEGTGGFIMEGDGLEVYGNVFFQSAGNGADYGNGAIGTWSSSELTGVKVFNNTFIGDLKGPVFGILTSDDTGDFSNNVFYNVNIGSTGAMTHTNNHYINVTSQPTETGKTSETVSANPFDVANLNFELKTPSLSGKVLSSPYNVDMFGQIRGDDGVWDRGAVEYVGAKGMMPGADSKLTGIQKLFKLLQNLSSVIIQALIPNSQK